MTPPESLGVESVGDTLFLGWCVGLLLPHRLCTTHHSRQIKTTNTP